MEDGCRDIIYTFRGLLLGSEFGRCGERTVKDGRLWVGVFLGRV